MKIVTKDGTVYPVNMAEENVVRGAWANGRMPYIERRIRELNLRDKDGQPVMAKDIIRIS